MERTDRLVRVEWGCRIAFIVGQLGVGGLERQLYYLVRHLASGEYRPAVIVWNFSPDDFYVPKIQSLGVPVYGLPEGFSRAQKLQRIRSLLRKMGAEVVHSYSFFTNFAAFWAALGRNVVPIGSVRSNFTFDKREAGLILGPLSARVPRYQIINSYTAAENVRKSSSLKVFVVRNAVDLETFNGGPASTQGQFKIVGVGSLLPVKRWDRLIYAARKLRERGLDFSIRIVGDGPMKGELTQLTESLGIAEFVEFVGHRENVPALMRKASLIVLTSEHEGCPNVILEAMACSRAVVATDAGEVPLLVEHGNTGYVVRRGDVNALVDYIAKLIVDRNLCQTMGRIARRKAEREFSMKRLLAETFGAYEAAGWTRNGSCVE